MSIRDIIRNYRASEETSLKHATSILPTPEEEAEINPNDNWEGTPEPENHEQATLHVTHTQLKKEHVRNDIKNDEYDTK